MASATYRLLREAMTKRRQVVCLYDGWRREICPIILGHSKGEEMVLAFQFAGLSGSGLPPGGQWKCFRVAKMQELQQRDGRWYAGKEHRYAQSCVEEVELDVNPESPYRR